MAEHFGACWGSWPQTICRSGLAHGPGGPYDHGQYSPKALLLPFIVLVLIFILRAWVVWLRERVGFPAGQHIRFEIRRQVLDRLQQAGPAWIQGKPAEVGPR